MKEFVDTNNEYYATIRLPMILTCGSPEEVRKLEKMRQSNFKKDLDAYVI